MTDPFPLPSMYHPSHYLARAPLIDASQRVLGFRLAWQSCDACAGAAGAAQFRQLVALVARFPPPAAQSRFFIQMPADALSADGLQHLDPAATVLMFSQAGLSCPRGIELAMALHAQGFALALCDPDVALFEANDGVLSLMTHVVADLSHPELARIASLALRARPALQLLVAGVSDWNEFDATVALGLPAFFGRMCTSPRSLPRVAEMGPQTALIVQLMKMLQDNADIRELEAVLKRDAMLSYKLLRYLNTAGFGLRVEIESLRHAITMLGYLPLYRWLSLLLASTGAAGSSRALLQAAIVRGRFVELLGMGLLPASEAGNLFVVGLFSLLDQLLGIPMRQLMRQVSLPEAIGRALMDRQDVYGPFLALAEACEDEGGCAAALANTLFMTPSQVNTAHGAAMVWTQNLQL